MAEMSMVEKVARAIWREREKQFPERVRRPEPDTFDNASGAWDMVLDQARAAIEAIRDVQPTKEMMEAMWSLTFSNTAESFATCWSAMIDAALSEEVAG